MNKRRNIYRGVNKRRNSLGKLMATGSIVICILGGAVFIKHFNLSSIKEKIKELTEFHLIGNSSVEEFDYKDIVDVKDSSDNTEIEVDNENVKVATVTNWDMYSIQIAAINNEEDINEIQTKLANSNIPFSIVEIDGVKKVQTYVSMDEDESRKYLELVKEQFSDAFVTKLEVPLVRLDYTDKYAYVEEICKELNNLINNFKEESEFWIKNNEIVDIKEYKSIQENRASILDNIEKQGKKINYDGMNAFKENLLNYSSSINDKSKESLKMIEDENYYVAKSLFMSSMQGYYSFINSIKAV